VSTERTILSPFTKEYRVLAADSGIPQFFKGDFLRISPHQFYCKGSLVHTERFFFTFLIKLSVFKNALPTDTYSLQLYMFTDSKAGF
jgi:hypothetical protein